MLRKRVDRIRGIAGTLNGRSVLIADAAAGPGPGLLRVISHAGAAVTAAATDHALLDVTIGKIDSPPHPIGTVAELDPLPNRVDDLVLNPAAATDIAAMTPWLELAAGIASNLQNRGRTGSIVFVIPIARTGSAGSVSEFLRSEMENMAALLAPNAIRVNAVACGPVGATRRGQPRSHQATPLGHMTIHPVDIGKAAWFLLNSDLSAAITGATLRVDRGAGLVRPDW